MSAVLDDAGGVVSGWSYVFDSLVAALQPYWVTVRGSDAAANLSSYAYTNFTIS